MFRIPSQILSNLGSSLQLNSFSFPFLEKFLFVKIKGNLRLCENTEHPALRYYRCISEGNPSSKVLDVYFDW